MSVSADGANVTYAGPADTTIDTMIKASGEFNGIEGTFSLDGNKLVFAPQGQTWTVSATLTF